FTIRRPIANVKTSLALLYILTYNVLCCHIAMKICFRVLEQNEYSCGIRPLILYTLKALHPMMKGF
ncbi:hypothetical protein, partial [Desulfitobacterium sp.]|uniref:hypothetical protein n=1 Tax=Desulfitobacterium sp. TaxID=49981 RepID=UPI002B63E4BD